jgi:hypothetical protein
MMKLIVAAVAVLIAAGIAYVLVVPGALDQIGVEVVEQEPAAPAIPAKDDSRITTPSNGTTEQVESGDMPTVGVLDLAALPFESGCGMFLSREGEEGIVFVDSTPSGENGDASGVMPAAMLIDGTLMAFSRTTADGEPIGFGQYPRQVFDSTDNTVRVVVEVDFGEESDPEDVPVSAGEVTVMKAGRPTVKFAISGGAGC